MFNRYFMTGLFLIFAVGCSQPKKPARNVVFVPHITPQGLKQFQFSVNNPSKVKKANQSRPGGKSGGKGGGGRGNKGGGQGRDLARQRGSHDEDKNLSRMKNEIEALLNKSGFCRDGFMEIDHYREAGRYYFNGQCNELATVKDRQMFKNK